MASKRTITELKRTYTDFVDGENMAMREPMSSTQVDIFAHMTIHLDITRPCGDDVTHDPIKARELMSIGSRRVSLINQIEKFDTATQKNIGERYRYFAEQYNSSLGEHDVDEME